MSRKLGNLSLSTTETKFPFIYSIFFIIYLFILFFLFLRGFLNFSGLTSQTSIVTCENFDSMQRLDRSPCGQFQHLFP